jgi:hypothetical protein
VKVGVEDPGIDVENFSVQNLINLINILHYRIITDVSLLASPNFQNLVHNRIVVPGRINLHSWIVREVFKLTAQ